MIFIMYIILYGKELQHHVISQPAYNLLIIYQGLEILAMLSSKVYTGMLFMIQHTYSISNKQYLYM